MLLEETIKKIGDLNQEAMDAASSHLDNLTKPPGSLGKLEDLAVQLAGIFQNPRPVINKKTHIIMVGDHGVVAEGVSAFPAEVTTKMVENFLQGGAAINVLTRQAGVELLLVDIGMKDTVVDDRVLNYKVRAGTGNMVKELAMTREQAVRAIEVGIEVAGLAVDQGAQLLGTGEMGIGNTTASSAILAVLSQKAMKEIVGPGTGINNQQLVGKIKVIEQALAFHQPTFNDVIEVLKGVGGLEIAGMTGIMLGAAAARVPVIIDGFISGVAALIARELCPMSLKYMIPSHLSEEPGHQIVYQLLGLQPMIQLGMRLGEGTGAVLVMNLVEAACHIIGQMATFDELGISGGDVV